MGALGQIKAAVGDLRTNALDYGLIGVGAAVGVVAFKKFAEGPILDLVGKLPLPAAVAPYVPGTVLLLSGAIIGPLAAKKIKNPYAKAAGVGAGIGLAVAGVADLVAQSGLLSKVGLTGVGDYSNDLLMLQGADVLVESSPLHGADVLVESRPLGDLGYYGHGM